MKTSTDKTRVVGKETYLNQSTGELVEMNVIE
ncbi:replication/maintenance protein RepL, partial [Vibrio splendidus]